METCEQETHPPVFDKDVKTHVDNIPSTGSTTYSENVNMNVEEISMKKEKLDEPNHIEAPSGQINYLPHHHAAEQDYLGHSSNSENPHALFKCSICLKLFCAKKSFEFHVKTQHSDDKFKCSDCEKTFKTKNDLDRHVNVHKGVRPYPCPECEKSFICRSSLNRHRKLQHLIGDIYRCHVCEKSFRVEQDLNRHLHTHTGTRPWSCDMCSKSFTCKSSLNVHRRSHDDSKKLCCQFCQKRFHIKMDLVRHEALHTGDRKWGCALCPKKYSGKSALKRHIRDSHFLRKTDKGSLTSDDLRELLTESGIDPEIIDSCIDYKGDNLDVTEEN